ncbi:DUF938 domain-containing protein [Acaryochloris marina]|uniref:SAM-dependent methyltransferase n=1 Tax=Acaryochloris marina (strain MBIC 11017) TaxID=329726 RepID=B0C137_ACAM1|nr:DUF938 domain-containing protein [Acaryochloris marina]ABW28435.1 conserved hypothetical protein [Acaryochloris marina MBIC11017]BDM77437.1 SAM-dependent methyltransferase [Acaryochloris marina MBIC10699]
MPNGDQRQYAPAFQRNHQPIFTILKQVLPQQGIVLEIASGTGEHVAFLAQQLPHLDWLPSDQSSASLTSITAWRHQARAANLNEPIALDVCKPNWPEIVIQTLDRYGLTHSKIVAIININMIHIAPWQATEGLIAGSARLLSPQGLLYLYGPFIQANQPTAPSNLAFDQSLRHRNPEWGIRPLAEVSHLAAQHGLHLQQTVAMPANNLSVIWQQSASKSVSEHSVSQDKN